MLRADPNPFSLSTTLDFSLCCPSRVRLCIQDVAGRQVAVLADQLLRAGAHSVHWDGRSEDGGRAACGTYFARLEIEGAVEVRPIILIR
jgi:hypothetical protein